MSEEFQNTSKQGTQLGYPRKGPSGSLRYKFFNTNNLWVDLPALKASQIGISRSCSWPQNLYKKFDGALPLPVMKNSKTARLFLLLS